MIFLNKFFFIKIQVMEFNIFPPSSFESINIGHWTSFEKSTSLGIFTLNLNAALGIKVSY